VADGPASLPAILKALKAEDPSWAVSSLVEAAVRAALGAVGYPMDQPRAFEIGDAEPDDVTEVYDPARRRWARGHEGLWFMPETVSPHLPWVELLDRTGELVEVLPPGRRWTPTPTLEYRDDADHDDIWPRNSAGLTPTSPEVVAGD
jgi:hypothetical protein